MTLWDRIVNSWNYLLANTFWRLVFWYKKQTGWLDLNQIITVTGTIVNFDKNIKGLFNDGDISFDLKLDPGQNQYITGFGGRLTTSIASLGPTLHCEITPWTRNQFNIDLIQLGARVRVTGRHGFDGVHVGVTEWKEVIYALIRHMPNVNKGWFEIHGVTDLEII